MVVRVCLACAGCVWAAVWILLGREGIHRTVPFARLHELGRGMQRMLMALSTSRLCAATLSWQPFRNVAEELSVRLSGRGVRQSLEWCAALLLVAVGSSCVLVGIVTWSLMGVLIASVFAICAIPLRSAYLVRSRRRKLSEQMPDVFRTLATALSSGQTLMQAIDYVGLHAGGLAAEAFGRASLRLRCGMPAEHALNALAAELDVPGANLMTCALSISQRTGSPLRELFQRSAVLVEQQGELERSLAVKTAQVRLSVRVVCILPIAMVMLLSLLSPDFREGLDTPIGTGCLLIGAVLDGLALLLIRSILKGVL